MADLLTLHLKTKSESHSALESLFSQWDFDRKLIPKALQTVGNLFPHYSRHDESHSRQILVNIERLLGENLALLTATDTWLLLEAAYWHDIGMVVPQHDLEDALSDPKFDDFLQTFVSKPHHELHVIANTIKTKSNSFQIFFEGAPLDAVTRFRELMAEWFRSKHPARAELIVNAPHFSAGISSPRTELIPARLFSVLGRICSMHGASFDALMGPGGLSFREAGMARDDCHPRFVACLLRLGDLLDLDDNRFCPVMQGIAGQDRPALSKAHEDKHAAIRHLRIDQERISIEAECKTVDGYLEAFRWFGWLKTEMQAQMSQWRDIVPSRELGLLPMLGPVSVQLAGNLKILKNGERPAFSLDMHKAIELLQGKNLYENEYSCIRELLQNSVDATLLHIWMTHRAKLNDGSWISPDEAEIQNLFASAPINVTLTESDDNLTDTGETSCWTLTIQDFGTGISINDLQHMLLIGGSHNNVARRQVIDGMPEWMKPSGVFGIGFQSIFMLCDKISLRTKSLTTNDILDVTMYSPTGAREGLVVLNQLENDVSVPTGTTITLNFQREKFAKSWKAPFTDDGSLAFKLVDSLDPILDDSFPYTVAQLADRIREFGKNSLIPINGALKTLSGFYPIQAERNETLVSQEINPWRFIQTQDAKAKLRYWPHASRFFDGQHKTYYRGQKFETKNIFLPSVSVEIDLMSNSAGSWLNFSRDKVSATAQEKLETTVLTSLEAAVREDIAAWKAGIPPWTFQETQRPITSYFLKSMALQFGGTWIQHAECLGDAWLDVTWKPEGVNLRSIFQHDEWTLALLGASEESAVGQHDVAILEGFTIQAILASEWLKKPNKSLQILGNTEIFDQPANTRNELDHSRKNKVEIENQLFRTRLRFASQPMQPNDNAAFASALFRMIRSPHGNERVMSPLDDRFADLSLATGITLRARHLFPLVVSSNTQVLLPFLFLGSVRDNKIQVEATNEQLDRLCHWVQPRLQRHTDLSKIRSLYDELIDWIDNQIMGKTIFSERWRLARGLVDIHAPSEGADNSKTQ